MRLASGAVAVLIVFIRLHGSVVPVHSHNIMLDISIVIGRFSLDCHVFLHFLSNELGL